MLLTSLLYNQQNLLSQWLQSPGNINLLPQEQQNSNMKDMSENNTDFSADQENEDDNKINVIEKSKKI